MSFRHLDKEERELVQSQMGGARARMVARRNERKKEVKRAASHRYYHNGVELISSAVLDRLTERFIEEGENMDTITLLNMDYFEDYLNGELSKKGWACLSKFAQRHHRDLLDKNQ